MCLQVRTPVRQHTFLKCSLLTSFLDHLCYICIVFVMLSHLFIAALRSPEGKGLTSWLLFVLFIVI